MEIATQLIVMTREEYVSLTTAIVERILDERGNPYPSRSVTTPKIMSKNEAAVFMNVTTDEITKWHKKGYIFCAIIKRKRYYFKSDLIRFLQINNSVQH